jgi:hypothetical protein
MKTLRVVGVSAESRTESLPHASVERYPETDLFGVCSAARVLYGT